MKKFSKFSFAVIAVFALELVYPPLTVSAADGWTRLNPFNALPAPKWPEWASVKMPDVGEIPSQLARMHHRNMNALGKAVDYLNPFKSKTAVQPPPPPPTGSKKTRSISNSTNSRFWFPSFMKEERKPIGPSRSVSEFLDRPRIR
ncbi:MAG: hypothetical protein CMJ76_08685 [Planctomycetaceae bacterium]|nr:hypothetical protein [Planctomycetaceae bacterium]